jgi:hypothetical protein
VIGSALRDVVGSNGFQLNPTKHRLQIPSCHQEVTGLTVNAFLNVRRDYIKSVRAMIHAWERYGLAAAADTFISDYCPRDFSHLEPEPAFKAVLRGRLSYIGQVRGQRDPVYCKLRNHAHTIDADFIEASLPPLSYRIPMRSQAGDRWTRQLGRLSSNIFQLEVTKSNGDVGNGTGFCLTREFATTAAHNLKGRVTMHGFTQSVVATEAYLHAAGPDHIDAALLRYSSGLPALPYDRTIPDPGQEIAIVGFASLPGRQPSLGIYVGTVESRPTDYSQTRTFIHVSVPPAGGLSGSPVINARGVLVGLLIESVYENTGPDVPRREYSTVLPIKYVLEIDQGSAPYSLPI